MSQLMVIYHGGCTDGWCAAWIIDRCFGGVELHPARHGDDPPKVSGRNVVVVDFSYDAETMLEMNEDAHSLVVLDHHVSAQRECDGLAFCHFDMSKSGAMLAYEWCNSKGMVSQMSHGSKKSRRDIANGMRVLADYVQDNDLYRNRLPSTESINACIRSYSFDLLQWDMLARRCMIGMESFVMEGDAIRRYRKALIEQHKKRVDGKKVTIGGHEVPIVECTCLEIVSDLLHDLAVGHPFAASYYMQAERMVFSLRSEEGAVDVSEVAEKYGGGGHVNSAGFVIPRSGIIKI